MIEKQDKSAFLGLNSAFLALHFPKNTIKFGMKISLCSCENLLASKGQNLLSRTHTLDSKKNRTQKRDLSSG